MGITWVYHSDLTRTVGRTQEGRVNFRSQRDGIEGNIPNSKTVFWCRPGEEDAGTYDAYSPKTTGWNPKNWWFGDLSPFPRGKISGSMLVCGGVSIHYGWGGPWFGHLMNAHDIRRLVWWNVIFRRYSIDLFICYHCLIYMFQSCKDWTQTVTTSKTIYAHRLVVYHACLSCHKGNTFPLGDRVPPCRWKKAPACQQRA